MKQSLISFLLLVILPTVLWGADDSCSYPKDFTIDKRCYVRDNEKWLYPYNSVVAVETPPSGYCTGTIIHQVKNQETADKFLYTAKHCVVDDNGIVSDKLNIVTQSGTRITADKYRVGDYDSINDVNFNGDWAVYKIPEEYEYIYSTTFSDKPKIGLIPYSARVIGYGALKIMSDVEIEKFKELYYSYLTGKEHMHTEKDEGALGWNKGGVQVNNKFVKDFLTYLKDGSAQSFYYDIFEDVSRLKVSKCRYLANGTEKGCQGWGGNSGGGIFDNDGNLMGIYTRGWRNIGGKIHGLGDGSINLLTPWRYDYETADMQGPLIQTEKIR